MSVKKENQPLVSVIMATFNESPRIVSEAISSILNQTYKNIELLIFDDSTKEETKICIDEFARDERVKINRFNMRLGFVPSLNKGLETAKGQYIARMDGDDISLPDRIEKEVSFLQAHPEVAVVGGQIDIINEDSGVVSHRTYPTGTIEMWMYSCARCPVAHPTVLMRTEIKDAGYRYNEELKVCEDLDLWLRLLNNGYKLANLEDTVLKYRVQSNFNEKRVNDSQRKCMADVRKANFRWSHPIHGALSVASGWLFTHVSASSIKNLYDRENRKQKVGEKL